MSSRLHDVFLDTKGLDLADLESFGEGLCVWQRGINWWLGDLARANAVLKLGDNSSQVFPPWASLKQIQRCEAVARAYPREEDRNPLASWSVHMTHANSPDRIALVAASVDAGRTSDEERKHTQDDRKPRWLLAVDVHYFLHRFWFSGAGVEAAISLADWLGRTVERLKEKGLTDVACCFDSPTNRRKELTKDWEDKYKDRPKKDPELVQQLHLVRELIAGKGFPCISHEGYEADDCMASLAKQFLGRVTLLTQDKDCKQCLSAKCNMLLDVTWKQDDHTGQHQPEYKWLSAKDHTEATGILPGQWAEFQALMGDPTDGVKGAAGIGEKGAADLINVFGTVEAAIAASRAEDDRIPARKRAALIDFEAKADITRQLVRLVDSLDIPTTTRL